MPCRPEFGPIDRRGFLRLVLAAPAAALLAFGTRPARANPSPASEDGRKALLEDSTFAYVSPLRSGGEESTCHAELWYGWLGGAVVVIVSRDGWKARALAQGQDRARIWIGNHGRVKGWLGSNTSFRQAQRFDAQGAVVREEALLDRLMEVYERKYPGEIAEWRDRMRSGFRDGSRLLLRYTPL
jgi:hypothetical protein